MGTLVVIHSTSHEDLCCFSLPSWPWPLPMALTFLTAQERTTLPSSLPTPSTSSQTPLLPKRTNMSRSTSTQCDQGLPRWNHLGLHLGEGGSQAAMPFAPRRPHQGRHRCHCQLQHQWREHPVRC